MNDLTKNILLWVVIVTVLLLVFSRYMPIAGQPQEIAYSQFLEDVKANREWLLDTLSYPLAER